MLHAHYCTSDFYSTSDTHVRTYVLSLSKATSWAHQHTHIPFHHTCHIPLVRGVRVPAPYLHLTTSHFITPPFHHITIVAAGARVKAPKPQLWIHTHQQLGPPLSPSSRTVSFHPHPHFGLWASAPESLGLKPSTSGPQSPHLFHIPAARATFGPSSRTTTYTQPHTQPHSSQSPTTMKQWYKSTLEGMAGQPASTSYFTSPIKFTSTTYLPIKLPA